MRSEERCLVIDDLARGGRGGLDALSDYLRGGGLRLLRFEPGPGELHAALQEALCAARGPDGASILALGAGCGAALALAAQLPVKRLALLDAPWTGPDAPADAALRRQLRRVSDYARRNLAFCVADVLLAAADVPPARRRLARLCRELPNARAARLFVRGDYAEALCSGRENAFKNSVYLFLKAGELPKTLAENPEMCIIV